MVETLHTYVYFSSLVLMVSRLYAEDTLVTDVVSFDVSIGDVDVGTIDIGLFGNTVPRTVKNFVVLATSEKGYGYTGTKFHRVIDDFMVQGGDYINNNGSGEGSIYGGRFEDENFILAHYGAGWLSMANAGPDSNTCQFFITARSTFWLDGKHVVFGKVLRGMWVLRQILNVETAENDAPKVDVVITKSSASKPDTPFTVAKTASDWLN